MESEPRSWLLSKSKHWEHPQGYAIMWLKVLAFSGGHSDGCRLRRRPGRRMEIMSNAEHEQDVYKPIVACVTVGMLEENCYLYACPRTREAVIIDPGDEAERILAKIKALNLVPKYIINT